MPDFAYQYTQTSSNVYHTRPSPEAHVVRFGALMEFSSETSLQTLYRSTFIKHSLDIFV